MELSVHPDVWLHPRLLVKLYPSAHFLQSHALPEVKLQVAVMYHVLFFIFQRQHQLLCFRHGQIKVCISHRWYSDICSGFIAFFFRASG